MDTQSGDPGKLMREAYRRRTETLEVERRKQRQQSLAYWRQTLQNNNRVPNTYIEVARCLKALGQYEHAIALLKEGLGRCAPSPELHEEYIRFLEKCNRTEDAIAAAYQATLLFPNDVFMKLKEALLLPRLYDSPEDVEHYRRRFTIGLHELAGQLSVDTPEARRCGLMGIGKHVNFLLAYQGRDDRELQIQYGELIHRIMTANYPQWAAPLQMPPLPIEGRIRIGYISPFFRDHTVANFFLGWLTEHDRRGFDVYAYHMGEEEDSITKEVRRAATQFRHYPDDLEGACTAIRSDNLHILVFLDIGMRPIMSQIAGLRLAPVQCLAWGHPVTSGLPTIDYYFSGSLTEPENGQDNYSERLVCLPGIGVCYRKPVIPRVLLSKTREEFGLRSDAVVYLSGQSTFKYLPHHDDVFAQIAKRIPNAQFVFLVRDSLIARDFATRLDRAFAALDLRAADHYVLLPRQSLLNYWNLSLLSDVTLDTIDWSGGRSAMDAIACELPVVTTSGRFMRGRQASAILTQLGITDTIANDKRDYVDIAVRLGHDVQFREDVIARMISGYSSLYSDKRCISALEGFFRSVTEEHLSGE